MNHYKDQLHGLKTVLDEMTDRLENYTSFAGAPEDAESLSLIHISDAIGKIISCSKKSL